MIYLSFHEMNLFTTCQDLYSLFDFDRNFGQPAKHENPRHWLKRPEAE